MRKLVVITSVIAALVAGASASAVTRIEHIGPNSERVFTCDRNYRPLYSQRQGALRLEGTPLNPLSIASSDLRHSRIRIYHFGHRVTVVEGRTYRVISNEGAGRVRYRDRC